jgi:TolA-binding protein
VFADYLERFPQGKYGARAAWRMGWWKYRSGDFESAATIFDQAAVNFPRSDYRPSWLYWAGRAYAKVNQTPRANSRFELVIDDYHPLSDASPACTWASRTSRSPVGAQPASAADVPPRPAPTRARSGS